MIVAYPMAPFGKEWKHLRTKELLLTDSTNKEAVSFYQNPRTNRINNSNTNNTIPTVFLRSNTHKCPNHNSSEQFIEKQLQNISQMSPVKSTSKGTNTNTESEIN